MSLPDPGLPQGGVPDIHIFGRVTLACDDEHQFLAH